MVADQLCRLSKGIIIKFQAAHDCPGNFLTFDRMSFKMSNSVFIHSLQGRFPHIMEKHGQAKDFVRPYVLQRMKGMFPYTVHMMGRLLLCLHKQVKFRQKDFCNSKPPCFTQKIRPVGNQYFHQLCLYALRTDICQRSGQFSHPFPRLFFQIEL